MAEDFERVETRLNNISSVRPILGALRTISLGSWQSALRKQTSVQAFEEHFREILTLLMADLPKNESMERRRLYHRTEEDRSDDAGLAKRQVMLVIGSERGLCGGFNSTMLRFAREKTDENSRDHDGFELWVLGSRLYRMMKRAGFSIHWAKALSTTALPDYQLAHELTSNWLRLYETFQVDHVDVIYNRYRGPGIYTPVLKRVIPPILDFNLSEGGLAEESWPKPIIETDPVGIYTKVLAQLTTMSVYQCLLNSAASEHAARYSLMEEAGQNSDRLIEEMTQVLQMYRRQKITQEMQELAAGAGLLG